MYTFLKFLSVGVLNTALDFAVLNVCVYFFGTGTHGELFVFFKTLSFLAAVTNSYFLNKWWVFEHDKAIGVKEPVLFFAVSTVGLLINVSVSFMIFTLFVNHITEHFAANVGALMGSCVVFAWNFVGYRFFVFKQHTD
jgi:putative flippase GtrA